MEKTYKIKNSEDMSQYIANHFSNEIVSIEETPSLLTAGNPPHKSTLTSPAGDIVIYSKSYFNWIQRWFIHFFTGFKVEIKKD